MAPSKHELANAVQEIEEIAAEMLARKVCGDREKGIEPDLKTWLTQATKTRDEQDKLNPNKPFPDEEYIWTMADTIKTEPVLFIEKSRTVMGTWTGCAVYALEGFTTGQMKYMFCAPDERRAKNCIDYVKALWENSTPKLKERWPLKKELHLQSTLVFELANGTKFEAIAGGADKVRSAHPTAIMIDEGAFVDDGAECMDVAMAANPLSIIVISSANPGWFREATEFASPDYSKPMPQGMSLRRTDNGVAVLRVHYTADPAKRGDWGATQKKKYVKGTNWDLEMEIKYDAKKGSLVYPDFDQSIHVVPDSMVPDSGCLFMAADPHPRTPHAFLWALIDRAGDVWIYREFWPSKVYAQPHEIKDGDEESLYSAKEYAQAIAGFEGNRIEFDGSKEDERGELIEDGEVIYDRFMDQAGKGFKVSADGSPFESYWERYRKYGFTFKEPYKIHQAGEDEIRDLMVPRPHDTYGKWPRIHIAASCRELILEFLKHRYEAMADHLMLRKELPQKGVEKRCHLLDCLRYIVTSKASYNPGFVSRIYRHFRVAA